MARDTDWLWGSLKPWQILHSTLAERERCGNVLDVWELVHANLQGATNYTDPRVINGHDEEEEEEEAREASYAMHFLADDGEFWKHGGIMEARVREWLAKRDAQTLNMPAATDHQILNYHHVSKLLSTETAAVYPAAMSVSTAWDTDNEDCKYEHEYSDEDEEENDDHDLEEQENSYYFRNNEEDISSFDYATTHNHTVMIRESASVFVINQCCSAVAAAAADTNQATGITAKLAVNIHGEVPRDQEELCPVCLEKLVASQFERVQALACSHAFHTSCISPCLQRQPHACCPCCRAPICAASLAMPPDLAAPLNVEAVQQLQIDDPHACAGNDQEGSDIMVLIDAMEAALYQLGFRC